MLKTRIKEYRGKENMKQSELAALIGVRRETIVHLENGRYNPSLKMAMLRNSKPNIKAKSICCLVLLYLSHRKTLRNPLDIFEFSFLQYSF